MKTSSKGMVARRSARRQGRGGRPARVLRVDKNRVGRELEGLRRFGYVVGGPAWRRGRKLLLRASRRGPLCLELALVRLLAAELLASAPDVRSVPAPWTAPRLALFLRALTGLDAQCVRCLGCPYDAVGGAD